MSATEDVSNAHWRALGTAVITAVLTVGILTGGIAIGYNLSAVQSEHVIQEEAE